MAAARLGNVEVVNILLKHGADVNVTNQMGTTPLALAANCTHMEVMQRLVAVGADVDAQDKFGPVILRPARENNMEVREQMCHNSVQNNSRLIVCDMLWLLCFALLCLFGCRRL